MTTKLTVAQGMIAQEIADLRNELFDAFVDSILEQNKLTQEQSDKLGEYLRSEAIEKRDGLANMLQSIELHMISPLREKEKTLAERRHKWEKIVSCTRAGIQNQLECMGVKNVEGLEHSFSIQDGRPSIEIDDLAALPGKFITYDPVADKNAIAHALADGEVVPGAHLEKGKKHLVIR